MSPASDFFRERPLFEILSVYDKELALERWGDVEVRFLEKRQGGFQIGIGVSDIPRARQQVKRLGLPEQAPTNAPAQAVFEGPQEPYETSAVLLAKELPDPYQYVVPVYFTNYTYVARKDGRERRPADRHPALRNPHPNTATRIAAAFLAVDDPAERAGLPRPESAGGTTAGRKRARPPRFAVFSSSRGCRIRRAGGRRPSRSPDILLPCSSFS